MEEGRQLTKERAGKIRKANRVQKIRASEDGVSQSRRGGAVCPVVAVSLQVTWGPAAQGPASGLGFWVISLSISHPPAALSFMKLLKRFFLPACACPVSEPFGGLLSSELIQNYPVKGWKQFVS